MSANSTVDHTGLASQILEILSKAVLEIGPLLDQAFETYPDFEAWVTEELPLQPHTAERMRAMWHVHELRPNDPELPEAWKACWSLG